MPTNTIHVITIPSDPKGDSPEHEVCIIGATVDEIAEARIGRPLGAGGMLVQTATTHGIRPLVALTLEELKARYPLAQAAIPARAKAPTRPMRAATPCPPPREEET